MARSDITVLMIENGVLRGVSLVPRGKREWSLSRSGEWKLEYPEAAEAASLSDTAEALASLQENSSDATVAMTDTPEMRAIMVFTIEFSGKLTIPLVWSSLISKLISNYFLNISNKSFVGL